MKFKNIISWLLRIVASLILLQTLYFKFTGSPESVELFRQLVDKNLEVYARIGTGVLELITAILLLLPSTVFMGAFFGMGIMASAIFSHLAILGIVSQGDGGLLFIYAIIVSICCLIILFNYKQQGINLYKKYLINDICTTISAVKITQ